MQETELCDGGDGPECSDLGNVEIPPTIKHRSTYNQSDFDFNPYEVIQHLLFEYKSSNFKVLLEGYKREIEKTTHPLCLREMESSLVGAALEYSNDRLDYIQFCYCLITGALQAQKASGSSPTDPNQTSSIVKYYDELWAEVCENSQQISVSEEREALLAKLACPSWPLSRLRRDIENISLERA
ncbi:unnamed protein product [Clonostachys rosea f. rosea IK726]|uniref:Uncharacterized protein n=2 Tax=Bionectria ochroleuca TaxID=29856 RepID=A0A0B7KPK2_BIOOC|nr:unnamed protein product [Clonostachys rosea f. rosea IK726]